jgi:hypothetical protein
MPEDTHAEQVDEAIEINPDGADLDGTAEIERQHGEQEGGANPVNRPTGSPPVGEKGDADDNVQTPPSALDLDRTASAARTGRERLHEELKQHTETGPAISGGDIDADWESASAIGDEAPGGDNPTPDQNIADEIGGALGLTYLDNEELRATDKVDARDRHRWELDPASSEDFHRR